MTRLTNSVGQEKTVSSQRTIDHGASRKGLFAVLNGLGVTALCIMTDFLSPVYPDDWSLWDADIFRVMGKVWAQGGLPYVDAWDSKGPLIFFLHMIGFSLGGPIHGVFIIDLALALFSAFFLWKIVDLTCDGLSLGKRTLCFWLSVIALALMLIPAWDMAETVCLPFLAASLWLALRSIRAITHSRSEEINPGDAYVHGLALSACAMTRITNGIVVCVTILVLTGLLVLRRRWTNLMACAAACVGGLATFAVPFGAYFAMRHAFDEFIYGTFLYNMAYAASSRGTFFSSFNILAACGLAIPMLAAICAIYVMARNRRCDTESVLYCIAGTVSAIMLLNLQPYLHYYVIDVVLIPFVISMLYKPARYRRIATAACITALACGISLLAYRGCSIASSPQRTAYETPMLEQVIQYSHKSVGVYGERAMLYLRYDLKPLYPYFSLQEWQASFSDDFSRRLVDSYSHPNSRYLLVYGNTHRRLVIQDALDSHYTKVAATKPNRYGAEVVLYQAKRIAPDTTQHTYRGR